MRTVRGAATAASLGEQARVEAGVTVGADTSPGQRGVDVDDMVEETAEALGDLFN